MDETPKPDAVRPILVVVLLVAFALAGVATILYFVMSGEGSRDSGSPSTTLMSWREGTRAT